MTDATDPRLPGHRFLHSPGPTRVPDAVLAALLRQPMDLGDPRVPALIDEVEQGLKALLHAPPGTALLMYAANGHGAWEAAIVNLLGPGRAALVPGAGHFSDAWAAMAGALGAPVVRCAGVPGEPVDPGAVEQALREDRGRRIAAVFAVHTDTAHGVTSELGALRAAIDAASHPALLVVDAVASLAATPLAMDALGADVVLGASQKGLMAPPGLAFSAVGERALAAARANPAPRFYWDWVRRTGPHSYARFCGTPPLGLLMGVRAALALLEAEGLDAVFARHRRLAGAVQAAVARWAEGGALAFHARVPAARAVSVTTVETAAGVDADALRTTARERFQVALAGGLGPLAGRAFRIGHLGDLNEPMVLGALAGVEATLAALGVAHGRGGVDAAIAALAAPDAR